MAYVLPVLTKVKQHQEALDVLEDLLNTHRGILEREADFVFYRNSRLTITCKRIRNVKTLWGILFNTEMPRMMQAQDGLELEADSDGLRIVFFLPDFRNQPILQKLA